MKKACHISIVIIMVAVILTACSGRTKADFARNAAVKEANMESENHVHAGDSGSKNQSEPEADDNPDMESNEEILEARYEAWDEYIDSVRNDSVRNEEVDKQVMSYGDATMKYGMTIVGEPDEDGYPLYIALHGGGASSTSLLNDSQWKIMGDYYLDSVKNGIYITPRAVRDTWDCHFNPESYPLYDRLIENMIAFYGADANRVYLMGFSAGGDGTYAITARMTDRFAAANMSAGHPNDIQLYNLYHMPIQLQVGINDDSFDRNIYTPAYGLLLDEYKEALGGGYIHKAYVHYGCGHNFKDNDEEDQCVIADNEKWLNEGDESIVYTDTNAVRFVEQYTRNPLPERVAWDLSLRADQRETNSFYWLQAEQSINDGLVVASIDSENNAINIEENTVEGEVEILISSDMLDVFSPITVNTEESSDTYTVIPDYEVIRETTFERGDFYYQFVGKIVIGDK